MTPPAGGWARLRARILAHETMHRRAPLSARLATLFAQGGLKAVVAPLVLLVALATTGAGAQLFATARPGSTLESETALVLQTRLAPEDRPGAVVHGPAPAAMPALQIAHDPRAPEPVGNTQPIARF